MKKQKIVILEKRFYIHPVFSNYAASKDGEIVNLKRMRPFRGRLNNCGYLLVNVSAPKEKKKTYSSHRFIWEAIMGLIPEGYEINHKNRIKTDNRIKNLELMTRQQNVEYSCNRKVIAINLETKEEQIFISIKIAGNDLDIKPSHISMICRKCKYCKSATSKSNGQKYRFRYVD